MSTTRTHRPPIVPNLAMRELRGNLSPREFAALIRQAGREIGERVSCDARYVGRVEAGEIRCPNYAYQRVFQHLWPEKSMADLGFDPRRSVRRRWPAHPATPVPLRGVGVSAAGTLGRIFTLFEVKPDAPQATSKPLDTWAVLVQSEQSMRWDLPWAPWDMGANEHPAAIATRHLRNDLGVRLPVSPTLLDVGRTGAGGTALVFDGGTITPIDTLLMRPLPGGRYREVQVVRLSELSAMRISKDAVSRILRALKNKHTGCGVPPPVK